MTTTTSVHTEGAEIVYDSEGDGPMLLTIAGGGGDAIRYAPIARMLAERLGCRYAEFRGNHMGFIMEPIGFATALREALQGLQTTG